MRTISLLFVSLGLLLSPHVAASQAAQGQQSRATSAPKPGAVVTGPQADVPVDYVIGPEDVIGVLFWREAEMTVDVTVRPDGMITLPLIGDIKATGMRPEALAKRLQEAAGKYLTDPNATVVVRQINSRRVFITGEVHTPNSYQLSGPRTVMQLIAMAGGLTEYAQSDKITIMRNVNGATKAFRFNYKDVSKGKHAEQNIQLQPGDTVVVP
jgi:polysaccharide biosynthesis/export protein